MFCPDLQNENAWVFCPEESLGASVKAYMDFEKQLKEKLPKEQRAKVQCSFPVAWQLEHLMQADDDPYVRK